LIQDTKDKRLLTQSLERFRFFGNASSVQGVSIPVLI
jgi:hypothetical protein